ncbi:hypothetical protein Tco_0574539, partial [Tanacetum coccineum]
MAEPLSPDHVFVFPADGLTLDVEDLHMEEEPEEDVAEAIPPLGSTFKVGGPSSVYAPLPYLFGREVKRLREDTET